MISSSKAVGASNLLEIIKKYALVNGYKKNVTVGVIGYPNVGKSSIINSLKKSKAAGVSSVPGFTKNI
jgi:nuclear GTP-binding protein